MNFVLHHHLAARDLGSSAAGAGAMLPDLWRMADRRVRPDPVQVAPGRPIVLQSAATESDDEGTAIVLAGVAHHVGVDRWFHADPVFTDGERDAAERLRRAGIAAPRTVMFAHVLWELCLDGALIRAVGFEAMMASLRAGIAEVRAGSGARAAERHHFDRVARSPEDRAAFDGRMERILEAIARGPWVEGYQSGDGIAERVQGVRMRLGLAAMDDADLARFAGVADRLLERAPEVVERILTGAKAGSIAATSAR